MRGERPTCHGIISTYYHYISTTTHLANGESSLVNIACEMKAEGLLNQLKYDPLQVVSPMAKAILLEPNHLEIPIDGYWHNWDGPIKLSSPLNQRGNEVITLTHAVRNGANDESLVPKGDI